MPAFNFLSIINGNLTGTSVFDEQDWLEWRYCVQGGRIFRELYLEKFDDREAAKEFERRKSLTPIPAFARREINAVKNSICQRFPDIQRRDGSKIWQDAVNGVGRGIDNRGSSMDGFLAKYIVPDLLIIGKVGILLDAPRVDGPTAADVPRGFRPYLNMFPMEHVGRRIPADPDSPSDWRAVCVTDITYDFNEETGEAKDKRSYRWFYLDPSRGNRVTVQKIKEDGAEDGPPIMTELEAIPFVVVDIGVSLAADACSYQIALLNMMSADSNYAIDSNYPLMVRQRGNANAGAYLIGDDDDVQGGLKKGLWYDKGLDAPSFIAPPPDPMRWSLELRREMKKEIHELVTGAIESLGDDGTLEAGLSFIGRQLEHGERRLWDHWEAIMHTNPGGRNSPIVHYPTTWSLKTDTQRVEEADALLTLMNKLPGRDVKKQAAVAAVDKLFRGKVSTAELDRMKRQILDAPYSTADPEILDMAAERGYVSTETGSLALGFEEGEAEKAKQERAEKAAVIVAAQTDAGAGAAMGASEGTIDDASASAAREGEADQTAEANEGPGQRGPGKSGRFESEE